MLNSSVRLSRGERLSPKVRRVVGISCQFFIACTPTTFNHLQTEGDIYTLFHNSAYRFFYSVDQKSYDPRLIISYQPRRFYEFYCKGFHQTKKALIAVWPMSVFFKKCVDEKTSVERSQSRTGNSIVRGILQVSVIIF